MTQTPTYVHPIGLLRIPAGPVDISRVDLAVVIRRGLARGVSLLVAILVIAGVSVTPAHASSSSDFVSKINAARASHGSAALAVKAELNAVAQAQAERMADKSDLFHNPNLGGSISNWSRLAENVGYGPDVATIHAAFMNSSGHRANILNVKYTEVGVGVVVRDQVMWVAEVFRRPAGAGSDTGSGGSTKAKRPAAKKPATAAKKPAAAKAPAAKKAAPRPAAAKPRIVAVAVPRSTPVAALRAQLADIDHNPAPSRVVSAKPALPLDPGGDFPLPAAVTVGLLALLILGNTARLRFR